jgi:hypothetical protein
MLTWLCNRYTESVTKPDDNADDKLTWDTDSNAHLADTQAV